MTLSRSHCWLALAAALSLAVGQSAQSGPRPNIVLILADDLGYGDLGCYSAESKIPTPNLDNLANQGMRFTDAHSPCAVCSPTRYGILTGRYSWRTELKRGVLWPWDEPLIEEDRLTIGKMLQEEGYDTACIGKWHLGWIWPTTDGTRYNSKNPIGAYNAGWSQVFEKKIDFTGRIRGGPTERGFDYYFGDDVPNFPPYAFIENDRLLAQPTAYYSGERFSRPGPIAEGWAMAQVMPKLCERSVEYILGEPREGKFHRDPNKPFFLYLPLTAPHTPIAPAAQFRGKSEAGLYGDYVNEVDWLVGKVMKALRESGQAENTLLIFTSDNGSPARDGSNMNGEPRSVLETGHNPSYIFRGIKADIWEGGHRVPFIARWPGKIKESATSNETICGVDFMRTLAAVVNRELPDDSAEDSFNILPALLGEDYESPIREAVVHHSGGGMFAIRQGKWKLILGKGSGGWSGAGEEGDPPIQLYDMQADPCESQNLQAEEPERIQHMTALLDRYKETGRSFSPNQD
ncbi:MAG: arylsulfatase [Candidatus Omnitrophica bacterium]|nr:arylsulfatase [Candidatus Omnitrophota bacterium]